MGTPFHPAITLPSSLELLASDAPSRPSPGERVASAALQLVMRSGSTAQLGAWGGDRWEQTNHYLGTIALAIQPYLNAARAAKFTVYKLANNPRDGFVKKALSASHYARDEDYEPLDPDHPLCRILARPNGARGKWSLAREAAFLTLQYMLTGDAPAWTPCNEAGKPVQFFALTSAGVQLQIPAGSDPRYPRGAYRVTPHVGGGSFGLAGGLYSQALLPAEEVARLTSEDPWHRGAGRSRLQVGAKEIDVLEAITKSRAAFFNDGPMLDAVIMMPGADLDVTQKLQNQIRERHGGADNHGRRILVLGGGGMTDKTEVRPIGMNAAEMGFLQSNEQAIEFVGALFGVPKPVMCLTDSSSYATFYAAKQQFYDLSLNPFFERMSDFLTTALADPWADEPGELKIVAEPPPLGDVEREAQELEFAYQNDAISVNEYRKATGRKPVADGDVPLSVWKAAQQQKYAPQPQPGGDPLAGLLDAPTAGAPPRPANPDAAGSLPPKATKAMTVIDDAAGGFLVAPGNRLRRRKRGDVVAKVLRGLDTPGE